MINKINFMIASLLLLSASLCAEIVTRAGIDIGSAETKLTIADVDNETHQIIHIWYQNAKSVELRADLGASPDGRLSKKIQTKLINTLKEMQAAAQDYSPQEWFGIATSVFRTAKNSQEVIDQIKRDTGITTSIIPQTEEAEVGFLSAVAASGKNPQEVISWDSGSGSFQITNLLEDHLKMYGTEFALVPALETLFALRGQPFSPDKSPNPVNIDESKALVSSIQAKLPPIPQWLSEREKEVIAIGGVSSVFSIGQIATGQSSYTKEEVWEAIIRLSGKTDADLKEFPLPGDVLIGLNLVYAVMDHCEIERITYCQTNGACEGVLISPHYWQ